MSTRSRFGLLLVVGLSAWAGDTPCRADQFEQIDGPLLLKMIRGADVAPRTALTVTDIGAMPALLRDTRSALVLARTDLGNPARLLLVPELRKPASGKGEPIPVIVLERLDTFDASDPSVRLTSRRDLVVFDGFQVDLDSGQIVPEGEGGDVVCRTRGEGGPRLEVIGPTRLFTMAKAPPLDTTKAPQPTPGKTVQPTDFAGRYRLFANGQWSGTLDLKVEGRGVVTGQFRSDLHGTSYAVSGQVAADVAHKILFAVKYPRARQEFEGYLWAEGKGAIAGVASINERPVGFFAIREGGKVAANEGAEIGPIGGNPTARHVVAIRGKQVFFDEKPTTVEELPGLLKPLIDQAAAWVLIRVQGDQAFGDLSKILEIVQSSGVTSIRLEALRPEE